MIKKCIIVMFSVVLSLTNAQAYDFEVDGMYYNLLSASDLTCEVTCKNILRPDFSDSRVNDYYGDVEIPEYVTYNGKTLHVIGIGNSAFKCCAISSIKIPNSISYIGSKAFASSSLQDIIVPSNVDSINSSAFYHCSDMTKVEIKGPIKRIRGKIFAECYKLETVDIPNTVKGIEANAFSGCKSLRTISIPSSVESIGKEAFSSCISLSSISLPSEIKKISERCFYNCLELKNIDIPEKVQEIGKEAFACCEQLSEVILSQELTRIGEKAFEGCNNLEHISFPRNLEILDNEIFLECENLLSITVNEENPFLSEINGIICNHDVTEFILMPPGLSTCIIPNQVTKIREYACENCEKLEEIVIPNNVVEIGKYAFSKCYGLKKITIPQSVKSIGYGSFSRDYIEECNLGCKASIVMFDYQGGFVLPVSYVKRITLLDNVTDFSRFDFSHTGNLERLTSLATIPPTMGSECFTNTQKLNIKVSVPKGCLEYYQKADVWKDFWNLSEIDITGIKNIVMDNSVGINYYNVKGQKINKIYKGFNIIKMPNGQTKKVLIK